MLCLKCRGTKRVRRSFLGLIHWSAPCTLCSQVTEIYPDYDRDESAVTPPASPSPPSGA